MGIRLLRSLTKYYKLVDKAVQDPAIVVPPELDFVPGPGDELESMIWVLTYAIMLHQHANLQGFAKTLYKRDVVDKFFGSLSYSGLVTFRDALVLGGTNDLAEERDDWFPDVVQRQWFRRAMALVAGQTMSFFNSSINPITFDGFDALCDEFIADE